MSRKKSAVSREVLKDRRRALGLTQQQMADKLYVSLRYYQRIEAGENDGSFGIWDALEDLLGVHQRKLREIANNHPDQEESR